MQKFQFRTVQYADISTAHITAKDGELILDPNAPLVLAVESDEHGTFLYIPFHPFAADLDADELRQFGFSEAFIQLVEALSTQGITHCRIHSSGSDVKGAPTFDW